MLNDLRFAIRMLRKSPGFVLIAILTLALGIGSNTAIFSLVNAWLIHPIDFLDPDRLVVLWQTNTKHGWISSVNPANFLDWREQSHAFESMSAWRFAQFDLSGSDEPERIRGSLVSAGFFSLLGVRPVLGRDFMPQEDQPGGGRVVLLSHGLWQRRFASDPNILGKNLIFDGEKCTVIGVMPKEFHLTLMGRAEMWAPLVFSEKERLDRQHGSLEVLARLKPGVSPQQGEASLAAVMSRLEKAYPETNTNQSVRLMTLATEIGRHTGSTAILVSFGIVACVLLIACANVANLMLARATGRQREVAVRLAVGAGRTQLMRQFLTENLLLFLVAGAFGVLFAFWGVAWIESSIPYENRGYLPHYAVLNVDVTTLAYTLFVAVFTGLLFGLAPALAGSKLDLATALKEGARGSSSHRGQRMRQSLVACEVALAVVVLIVSGLLIRSFVMALSVEPGFDRLNVITARLGLPAGRYSQPASITNFYRQFLDRIRSLPGVETAAAGQYVPFGSGGSSVEFVIVGKPEPRPGEVPSAIYNAATPDYLRTLKIGLVKGRFVSEQDGAETHKVAVVSDLLANRYWPNEDPIGKQIRLGRRSKENVTVIGVVRNIVMYSYMEPPQPELYVPFLQAPASDMVIVIRTNVSLAAIAPSLRTMVSAIDKDQPLGRIATLDQLVSDENKPFLILTQVMSFFALVALFLAVIGIYGVMAYAVSSRTPEIGIRVALGARRIDVLALVLRQGVKLVGVGAAIGLLASFGATRALETLLFNITATDPVTFSVMLLILAAAALLAVYLPARRAARIDPIVALRYE